jgi:molybdenum cofactor synthesis domain-containing protein
VIRAAILTVSDGVAAGKRLDGAGDLLAAWLEGRGWSLAERRVVPDEEPGIAAVLSDWADHARADLILTTGGTGFGPRDVTPEATSAVLERAAPGLAEALRAAGLKNTPFAALSRGVAGIRGSSLIVNLPGSEKAVREGLEVLDKIVPHAVDLLAGRTEHSRE